MQRQQARFYTCGGRVSPCSLAASQGPEFIRVFNPSEYFTCGILSLFLSPAGLLAWTPIYKVSPPPPPLPLLVVVIHSNASSPPLSLLAPSFSAGRRGRKGGKEWRKEGGVRRGKEDENRVFVRGCVMLPPPPPFLHVQNCTYVLVHAVAGGH